MKQCSRVARICDPWGLFAGLSLPLLPPTSGIFRSHSCPLLLRMFRESELLFVIHDPLVIDVCWCCRRNRNHKRYSSTRYFYSTTSSTSTVLVPVSREVQVRWLIVKARQKISPMKMKQTQPTVKNRDKRRKNGHNKVAGKT